MLSSPGGELEPLQVGHPRFLPDKPCQGLEQVCARTIAILFLMSIKIEFIASPGDSTDLHFQSCSSHQLTLNLGQDLNTYGFTHTCRYHRFQGRLV